MSSEPTNSAPARGTWHRLMPWAILVGGIVVVVAVWLQKPEPVGAVVLTVVVTLAVVAGFVSARRGLHTPFSEAREQLADDHAVVLWKPGCVYCEVLLRSVGRNPAVTWVNVYQDPEADAAVREVNDGNQLTPTALVGDRVLRNPSATELRAALAAPTT